MDDYDVDETARLILLELPERSLRLFNYELRVHHPEIDLLTVTTLWERYVGWDGRTMPTHDINTGKPIRSNK